MTYAGMAPRTAPAVWKTVEIPNVGDINGMYDTGSGMNFLNQDAREDLGQALQWTKLTRAVIIDTAGNDGCQDQDNQSRVRITETANVDLVNPVDEQVYTHVFYFMPGKYRAIFGRALGRFHKWGHFDEDEDFETPGEPDVPTSELEADFDAFHITADSDLNTYWDYEATGEKTCFVTEAPRPADADEISTELGPRVEPEDIKLKDSEEHELREMLGGFPDLFAKSRFDCGRIPDTTFRITLKDENFVHHEPPRNLSEEGEREAQAQVDEMLKMDFCERSSSPHAHGVLLRRKKSGEQRLCIDYRPINQQTVDDRWPLPDIKDLLRRVRGNYVFTALDMASAYNHIAIHPDDRHKTAFVTRKGLYQLKVMSFGFKNAPPFFQRTLTRILRGIPSIVVYLDDILIFTKTIREHLDILHKVLGRLHASDIRLKLPKCSFLKHELEYLGHVLSSEGIAPNPKYIEKCLEVPKPKSKKDLQRFVGVLNWVAMYTPLIASHLAPLTELLKSRYAKKPFSEVWGRVHDTAFDKCRHCVQHAGFLRHPDGLKPFTIFADASRYACGAVLMQPYPAEEIAIKGRLTAISDKASGVTKEQFERLQELRKKRSVFTTGEGELLWPVAFASHKFTETERRYHIVDLEIFAILMAIRLWRVWLQGRHFTVFTDARMARHFLLSAEAEGRHARWQAQLMGFHMTIKSVKGDDNVPADWMSREQVWTADEAREAFFATGCVVDYSKDADEDLMIIPDEAAAKTVTGRVALPAKDSGGVYPVISRFPVEPRPQPRSQETK